MCPSIVGDGDLRADRQRPTFLSGQDVLQLEDGGHTRGSPFGRPLCAGFSNRSINRWTSDSVIPTPPLFIGVGQRVPSRTKRRSVERRMPRRSAASLYVRVLSGGPVVSGDGKLLPSVCVQLLQRASSGTTAGFFSLDTFNAGRVDTEKQATRYLASAWFVGYP